MPDLTGRILLRRYRVDTFLGRGGMAEVYRAWDTKRSAYVALKLLNCDLRWQRDDFVARLRREVKALRRLDHENIVNILDSGQADEIYYLATEFVEGKNLAPVLQDRSMEEEEVE